MVPITSPITPQSRRYLRIAEAAAFLNVSVALLRKLKGLGRGPRYSKLGDLLIFCVDDLEDWVKQNLVQTKAA